MNTSPSRNITLPGLERVSRFREYRKHLASHINSTVSDTPLGRVACILAFALTCIVIYHMETLEDA